MLGATHMPDQLWVEAAHAAVYVCNRTPSSAVDGKTPWELWFDRELGSLKHIHEWGCTAFKHVEVRHRSGKLAPRGEKYYLVGYNGHNRTWRLWNPANPTKIVNSGEVSFRDTATRDCSKKVEDREGMPSFAPDFYDS